MFFPYMLQDNILHFFKINLTLQRKFSYLLVSFDK